MQQITTSADLRSLGDSIATDGLDAHVLIIDRLVATALLHDPSWVAAQVVGDRSVPQVVRLRAFAHLTADWDRVVGGARSERRAA